MKTTTDQLEQSIGPNWQDIATELVREGLVESFTITGTEVEITLSQQAEIDHMFELFAGFADEEADLRKNKYDI